MKYPDLLGKDVARVGVQTTRKYNLLASRMITDVIKTSLGPRGMDKMFIDIQGDVYVTKHGGAFLRKVDHEHPAAKAVVDAANSVDNHVGDGTISVVVLIGALCAKAEELLKSEIPPATIASGYQIASDIALETLASVAQKASVSSRDMMMWLALTCLKGKSISDMIDEEIVAKLIVDAVCTIADFKNNKIDVDDIKIEEKLGNATDVQLINGIVVDKTIDNYAMPKIIKDAKILLTNEFLEPTRTKIDDEIIITSPEQMNVFIKRESDTVIEKVQKIIDAGVNVVISRRGINQFAQECLARSGIISIKRATENDLWWLEKATGAKICEDLNNISKDELGCAKKVYEKTVGDDKMVFVDGCNNPKAITILLRANSKKYLEEFHRTVKNVYFVLRNFIENPQIVGGGGSVEAIIAQKVRQKAHMIEGKEQIVVEKFADALEEIPITLARNVGMDVIDTIVELRAKYAQFVNGNYEWIGIDSSQRKVAEVFSKNVVETLAVKEQVIKTAAETTIALLNVDDIFMKDEIDNTHCHIDGTVHAHHDGGKAHNHFEQEGIEQRQMHHYY
ncbi:MAG: thermosome subunit [Thaumarchaeota archaeon]|nr:thermosome subunit [Nitrososphaerota archaeon]